MVKNKERKADFKKLGIANICYNIIDAQLDLDMFSFKEATTQLTLRQWRTIVKRMNIGESQEAFSGVALDDLSRLAKVLGLFNNAATVEIKNPQGKLQKVKACDLAFNFFQKFVQDVPTGNMHRFLQGVQDNGFSGEFLKFVSNKTNYSEVIEKLNSNDDFLNMTYAWFRQRDELDLQQVSNSSLPQTEANRYKIKTIAVSEDGVEREHWNVPTAELLMKEFMTRKYSGINSTRDREIAEQFTAHTQYEQMHFEKAKEIDAERLQAGVPDFIVGTQVKNNRTQVYERFLNSAKKREYFEQTESLRDQIVDEAADALRAQKDISDKIFTYETLAKSDIANFYIGQLTNCCARLYAAGSGAMRAAILSPDMQPLVVRNDKDEIIAYSIMYINREQGYAVLNDIEVNSKYDYDPDLEKNTLIYEAMKECAVKNIQEFNKTASVKVKTLTAGLSPRVPKINDVIRKNPTTQTFKAPNFDDYKYVGAKSWRGDWHGTQYLIWSADEKAIEREGL